MFYVTCFYSVFYVFYISIPCFILSFYVMILSLFIMILVLDRSNLSHFRPGGGLRNGIFNYFGSEWKVNPLYRNPKLSNQKLNLRNIIIKKIKILLY